MRLVLAAGLLLAVVGTAHADWRVKTVPGVPSDVEVWAPGTFSVATSDEARLERDGGVSSSIDPPREVIGTYLSNSGCFMAFQSTGLSQSRNCLHPIDALPGTLGLRRVKMTESGAGYALGQIANGVSQVSYTPEYSLDGWPLIDQAVSGQATEALGVLRTGTAEDALLAVTQAGSVGLRWYRDGALQATYSYSDGTPRPQDVQAIDLVPSGGSTPNALVGWTTGLYRGSVAGDGPNPFTKVQLPGGDGTVTAVDVNTGVGSQYGDGFGMATVQRDGGVVLLSAVPAHRIEDVGTRWRVNGTLPPEAVAPRYLECHGGKFCVIAQKFADAGNLLVYANASAPTLIVDPETFLQEGTSRTLPVHVRDADGDAVQVTAEVVNPPAPLTVSVNETAEGVEVLLTALAVGCADREVKIQVTASDGLAEHDVSQDVIVRIIHSRRPNPPLIGVSNIRVEAGEPDFPITLTAPQNECPTSYEWTELAPGSSTITDAGLSRTFSTPPTLCAPEGMTYVYSVKSIERRPDLISDPTYFTVQVLPWGRPFAPFQEGPPRVLPSGGRLELNPERTHACDGDPGSGFPGVDTLWVLKSGERADGGVRLLTQDEKPIVGASAVTPGLVVEADRCVGANLEFSVQHFSRGNSSDAGVGPLSSVRVVVDAGWDPLSRGTVPLFDITSAPNAVVGDAGVENLNCLEQRGPLKARIRLASRDGSDVRTRDFTVPGPWWFSLEDVCEGGDYVLSAELLDESGLRAEGLAVDAVAVQVPPVEVPLQRLDTLYMTARCGEAARGVLEQPIPAGPCSRVPLTWTQLSGTPLTQPSFTGQRIEVATQVTDFGALIGESVGMRVTANTGVVSQVDQVVRITTEPFVEVQRFTEKATGTDADLIGVSVELSNTTACGVSQVDHVERLEGVDYVPGTARFNGTPVEPELIPEGIHWKGLVLEGNSMGRLTYVVRPRLLEKPRFEGQSSLRDIPISQPLEEPPPAGCGCAGGGSGGAVLGLVGLLAALRRRRGT